MDLLFGTYYCPRDQWPEAYGLDQPTFDDTYYAHVVWPFTDQRPPVDHSSAGKPD